MRRDMRNFSTIIIVAAVLVIFFTLIAPSMIVNAAKDAFMQKVSEIPEPNPDVECFTEDEILVQLGDRTFLMPWKMAVFDRTETIPTEPAYTYPYCRYKWEKAVHVTEIRFNNANEYKDERKELLPYKYLTDKKEKRKIIEAGKPIIQKMGFIVTRLDEPYEAKTLEEMARHDMKKMIANHYKKNETVKRLTGKAKEFLLSQMSDPRRLEFLKKWEGKTIELDSLPLKEGFRELERLQYSNSKYYYGYLPNLKIPVKLACGKERICTCRVVLDKETNLVAKMIYGRDTSRFKYMQGLNIYAEECEVAVKELMLMEQYAQKKINKEQNEVNK